MKTIHCTLCGRSLGIRAFHKGYICRDCLAYIRGVVLDPLPVPVPGQDPGLREANHLS